MFHRRRTDPHHGLIQVRTREQQTRVRRARHHCLCVESLEGRALLSGSSFGEEQVVAQVELDQVYAVVLADLDGDGDQEVLAGSFENGKVAWHENLDGKGTFGTQQIISSTSSRRIYGVLAGDLDGDGDQDVIASSSSSSGIVEWYENVDSRGSFGPPRIIQEDNGIRISLHAVKDLDGDGDLDVVTSSGGIDNGPWKLTWLRNDGRGSFGTPKVISTTYVGRQSSVLVADFDADGDLDIAASYRDSGVAWFANVDGAGRFELRQQERHGSSDQHRLDDVGDVDNDGDLDILYTEGIGSYFLNWRENSPAGGVLGAPHRISAAAPSDGTWRSYYSPRLIDLDGDGDRDVIAYSVASGAIQQIVWYENVGAGQFGAPTMMSTPYVSGSRVFAPSDLDQDGRVDFVQGADDELAWFKNIGGASRSMAPKPISNKIGGDEVDGAQTVDLDGDGDLDLLSASSDKVVWFENSDGLGHFLAPQIVVSSQSAGELHALAADIDDDGDQDVLVWHMFANNSFIAWYENLDHAKRFGEQRVITSGAWYRWGDQPSGVSVHDIDGDGDVDLFWTDRGTLGTQYKFAWQENLDGRGTFGPSRTISTSDEVLVEAADLDHDGDLDLVVIGNTLGWYENRDGRGRFGSFKAITGGYIAKVSRRRRHGWRWRSRLGRARSGGRRNEHRHQTL